MRVCVRSPGCEEWVRRVAAAVYSPGIEVELTQWRKRVRAASTSAQVESASQVEVAVVAAAAPRSAAHTDIAVHTVVFTQLFSPRRATALASPRWIF